MVMELIVGSIGLAFVILVVFLIITLQKLRKLMNKADRTLTDINSILSVITEPGIEMISNANKLVADVKKKSESLDFLFRPLYALKKEKSESKNGCDKISELIDCVADGVRLFSKIKNEIK